MAFDLSTAKPASGFDLSTAKPVRSAPEINPTVTYEEEQTPTVLNPVVAELAGAANRGVAKGADFFIDAANYVLPDSLQIPRAEDTLEDITGGTRNFMEPGLARDVVQVGGEYIPAVATMASSGAREGARYLGKVSKEAQDALAAQTAGHIRRGDVSAINQKIVGGKVVSDPTAKGAVRQGFDEGVVSAIKASNKQTKTQMGKMVDILEKGKANKLQSFGQRPTDVVGDVVAKRMRDVMRANKQAGKQIRIESLLLQGKKADFDGATNEFARKLRELGVKTGDDLRFVGSDVEDVAPAERLLRTIYKRAQTLGDDALSGHKLKKFIDEQVTFGKSEGLSGKAESVVKALRRDIDGVLDNSFEGYRKANDVYSETIRALDDFQSAAGRIDFSSPNIDKALGVLTRRLTGNAQSRARLIDALDSINSGAAKYGRPMREDVRAMILFADDMENVFKPAASTSFKGEVQRAASDIATQGPGRAALNRGIEKAAEKLTGVDEQKAVMVIRDLLSN